MDVNSVKLEFLNALDAVAAPLGLLALEMRIFRESELAPFAKKNFSQSLSPVPVDQFVEAHSLPTRDSREIIDETVGQGESLLYIRIVPLYNGDIPTGYLFLQNSAPFDESDTAVTSFIARVLNIFDSIFSNDVIESDKKYKEELNKMRTIQAKLFPKFDDVTGLDIGSVFLPVELMSGDFVDAFFLNDTVYQIVACDVTGFDASSNFAGAAIRTLVRSQGKMVPSVLVQTIISRVSRMIQGIHGLIYLTVLQIDTKTGKCLASSYGDINLIYLSGTKKATASLGKTRIGLELAKRNTMKDLSFTLDVGDMLLYFSHGVVNATSADGRNLYGESRLTTVLREEYDSSAREIVYSITDSMYQFANFEPLSEDVILVAIKRSGMV